MKGTCTKCNTDFLRFQLGDHQCKESPAETIEKLTNENKQLTNENKQLKEELKIYE